MLILISVAILILFIYMFISYFIFKRKWQIKEKRLHPFKADRSKSFHITEITVIIVYAIFGLIYINFPKTSEPSPTFISSLTLLLLFILSMIRGAEIWNNNRNDKAYYYEFTGALMFILLFFLFYFGEKFL